jgi:hypothetical protein
MKKLLTIIVFAAILFIAGACVKTTTPTDPGYHYKVGPLKPSNIDYAYCGRIFAHDGCGQCHEIY